jgi:hypothetical protein
MKKFKILFAVSFMAFTSLWSQTQEQVKNFINKSPIAITKVQKELYYKKNASYNADLKLIFKNQLKAIELYKQNNLKEALNYSYEAREVSMNLLSKIGVTIPKETLIEPFETEFFQKNKNFVANSVTPESLQKCNMLDYKQTAQFILYILN